MSEICLALKQSKPTAATGHRLAILNKANQAGISCHLAWAIGRNQDPVSFNEKVLCRKPYWSAQEEIARAADRYKTVVAVTGNAVGKSYLAVGLGLWWIMRRPGSIAICTAPSKNLLSSVLFKEARKAIDLMQEKWGLKPPKVSQSAGGMLAIDFGVPGWGILGIATRGVERLSGQHDPNLIQILDEASGLLAETWEALGSQAPSKLLVFGNPLTAYTQFHRLYLRGLREEELRDIPDDERVKSFRLSSLQSPDAQESRSKRGLADGGFLKEAERSWGRNSLHWRTHIEGLFPSEATDSLVELGWLDRVEDHPLGQNPYRTAAKSLPTMAVDVAAGTGRDRTAILIRDYFQILHIEASNKISVPEAAKRIRDLANQYHVPHDRIVYDASGLGLDLTRHLKPFGIVSAVPYNGSGSGATVSGQVFTNHRASCAWRLRERFDPSTLFLVEDLQQRFGGANDPDNYICPEDEYRVRELERCGIRWGPTPSSESTATHAPGFRVPPKFLCGQEKWYTLKEELLQLRYRPGRQISLEPKQDMAKRLGRSPDLADALLMSFAIEEQWSW